MKVDEAASLLGVPADALRHFDETDPFNSIRVKGYISRQRDSRYGALVIYYADGNIDAHVVWGTPKFAYPFDRTGRISFPDVRSIEVYEKIDGTNILGFTYPVRGSQPAVSYKTRLRPFVGNSAAGRFLSLWSDVLSSYPAISALVANAGGSVGFELYGARNEHLIRYDVPLDTRVLYRVRPGGHLEPPSEFDTYNIPSARRVINLRLEARASPPDLVSLYQQHKADLSSLLRRTDEGVYIGLEGYMWYAELAGGGRWQAFKCKPNEIEAIHFAARGINKNDILHAAWRVVEDSTDLDDSSLIRDTARMLEEDWSEAEVSKVRSLIPDVLSELKDELRFRADCIEAYRKLQARGLSIKTHKPEVLRHLSSLFPAHLMRKVYSLLSLEEK
jgi:hypothetical protein